MNVSFAEAIKGGEREVSFTSLSSCNTCSGTGAKNKKPELNKCKRCNGRGVVVRTVGGFMQVQLYTIGLWPNIQSIPKPN